MEPLMIHHTVEKNPEVKVQDTHTDAYSLATLGFWIYLMTDCLVFATLFATYAVLHGQTFGGPSSKELFNLPLAFAETMLLLFSSVTCGCALLASVSQKRSQVIFWLIVTFILGASFIGIELSEFKEFIDQGNSFKRSAFLSSFFTLVGTHGLHVTCGLLWMAVMIAQVFFSGITQDTFRRLVIFGLFWHFLDLVWIFIFTVVYLMGVIV